MYIKKATVTNQVGLHARPATFLIQKANEFNTVSGLKKTTEKSTQRACSASYPSALQKAPPSASSATGGRVAVETLCKLIGQTSPNKIDTTNRSAAKQTCFAYFFIFHCRTRRIMRQFEGI